MALLVAIWIVLSPFWCVYPPGQPPQCGIGSDYTDVFLPIVIKN